MKKWSLLVATLMLMGAAATTFTSCVDTDEPEGILELRKAKAEYIRALAAVENAKISVQQAAANAESAKAEISKAEAAVLLAKAKIAEAEAAKLNMEAEQAKAELDQTIAENKIVLKEMEAKLEVVLVQTQAEMAKAQANYELAKKDLAAIALVASPVEAQLVANAQSAYDTAFNALEGASALVTAKQKALFDALYGAEDDQAKLDHMLVDKKARLEAVKAAYAELQKLDENISATAWEARLDSLNALLGGRVDGYWVGGSIAQDVAELQLKLEELKQTPEYKAAAQKEADDKNAYIQAQQYYNYLADPKAADLMKDCFADGTPVYGKTADATTHDPAKFTTDGVAPKEYTFNEIKFKVENSELRKKLEAKGYTFNDKNETKVIAKNEHVTYQNVPTAFAKKLDDDKFAYSNKLRKFEEDVLAAVVTPEQAENDTCNNTDAKALADAQKAHNDNIAAWQKAHTAYQKQAVEATVSNATFKTSIGKFNDNVDALVSAVNAYNTAYDTQKEALYNKNLETAKIAYAKGQIEAITGLIGDRNSLALIDALIESTTLSATDKATMKTNVRTAIQDRWETQSAATIRERETAAKPSDAEIRATDAVKDALKAITNEDPEHPGVMQAINKKLEKETDTEKFDNGSYKSIADAVKAFDQAAKDNCEKLKKAEDSNDTNIAKYTGVEAKYANAEGTDKGVVEAGDWYKPEYVKDGEIMKPTGHLTVVRTKISDDNINKMCAVEFDSAQAAENWKNTSIAAFGTSAGRHVEITAADLKDTATDFAESTLKEDGSTLVGGSLLALMKAQSKITSHEDVAAFNAAKEALNTEITKATDTLKAAIAEVSKDVDAQKEVVATAKATHQESYQAAKKMTQELDDQIAKLTEEGDGKYITEMKKIREALEKIIDAYKDNKTVCWTDEDGNEHKYTLSNFYDIKDWLKYQMERYTGKTIGDHTMHGLIYEAEQAVADLEKVIARVNENGYSSGANNDVWSILVADAQYDLEYAQKQYENKVAAFVRAEAALAKVLEAVGNGVAANVDPSTVGTGANGTSGTYNPTDEKIHIDL